MRFKFKNSNTMYMLHNGRPTDFIEENIFLLT